MAREHPESRQLARAVVCDPQGHPRFETTAPGIVTTLRSAAKRSRLLPLVELEPSVI